MNEQKGILNQSASAENQNPIINPANTPPTPPYSPYSPYTPPKKAKKIFDFSVRDVVFLILLSVYAIFLAAFGIFDGFRGGFTASALMLTMILSAYLWDKTCKIKAFPLICLILNVILSLNFSLTSNSAVRFFSVIAFFSLSLVWFTSIKRTETEMGDVGFLKYLCFPLYETGENIPPTFVSMFSQNKNGSKTVLTILTGALVALPVAVVVVPLLVSSDEAFSGMITKILDKTASSIFKILLGLFLAVFILPYALTLKKDKPAQRKSSTFSGIEPIAVISFLSVLSVCYLSYLFSQLAYFFDAFKGFLPAGYEFSLAEYARRGFFEMCIIALINFVLIFLCRILTQKNNKKIAAVNALSTFICIFTLVIIATALSKMFLYIKNFGMTELRITTSVFMFFLAIVFIALIAGLYCAKINIVKVAFAVASIALILLGTVNVNKVVAEYNYTAYKNGTLKTVDVDTIAQLGDEGIPYLIMLTEDKDEGTASYAKNHLALAYIDYYELKYFPEDYYELKERIYDDLGEFSIPRQRAYKELEKYIESNPDILMYHREYTLNHQADENEFYDYEDYPDDAEYF